MHPLTLAVSKSSAFSRPRSSSPVDVENSAEDLSRKEVSPASSPSASERLSPEPLEHSMCNGRANNSFPEHQTAFKTPLRFGVDSLISPSSRTDSTKDTSDKSETFTSKHSPIFCGKDRDSDSSYHRSPRSDTSSPHSEPSPPPPAHNKSHSSSFTMDEILGKSPASSSTSSRLSETTSPAYVPSPAHETRWPSSLAVSAGFPWLPSSRISPPPSK